MNPRTTTTVISILGFCLTVLSAQAEVYSDTSAASKLLSLSAKEKDTKKAITYALQSLSIGAQLNSHLIMAKSYQQLSYRYGQEKNPRLYEIDSLCRYHASRSGDEPLLFDALQLTVKNYLNNNQVPEAEKYLPWLDSLTENGDTLFRKCVVAQIKAFYHFKRFKPVESLAEAWISLAYAEKIPSTLLTGRALYQVGKAYMYRFKHDSAAIYLFKAIDVFKKTNNAFEMGNIYNSLAFQFQATGNLSKAIAYYDMSYAAFDKAAYPIEAAYVPLAMCDIYFTQHKNDTAFLCINKAISIFKKYAFDQGLGVAYSYLGRYYTKVNQKDSATYYSTLSKETLKQYNSSVLSFYAEGYEAINAIESKDYKKGDSLFKNVFGKMGKVISKELLTGAAEMVAYPGYTKQEQEATKQILLRDADQVGIEPDSFMINPFTGTLPQLDSLIALKQQEQIAAIEIKYKVKEANDSTRLAKQESLLIKQQLDQRNLVLLFSILLLAVSGLLLYVQVKNRKRALADKQQAVEDKATIEHLKKELSHRVRNNLENIAFIIDLVRTRSTDKKSFDLLEEKVMPIMVLYRMLDEQNTENINLQDYFEAICSGLKASYDHDNKVTLRIEAPVIINGNRAGRLGLILYELVTNSFKYAFHDQAAGNIEVICARHDDKYYLSITDSGPGIQPMPRSGTREGLQLVKALAQQLKATIRQKQVPGAGFEFYFR